MPEESRESSRENSGKSPGKPFGQPPGSGASETYYQLLGLTPAASVQQIRRAYRELSKLYHPDTTELPGAIATAKFQQLNEAYATLSSPERRAGYDLKIGYSRVTVVQMPADTIRSTPRKYRSSAYLDPSDRPLSAGELFALFVLGITFLGCLVLVITVGMTRGEIAFQSLNPTNLLKPSESMEVVEERMPASAVQVTGEQEGQVRAGEMRQEGRWEDEVRERDVQDWRMDEAEG